MLADMQTRNESVDFPEAIRIVARLALDDGRLADFMTDEWIILGLGRFGDGDGYADDAPMMVNLYGSDWRAVRHKVLVAYWTACKTLGDVLKQNKIAGKGRLPIEKGRREITKDEWADCYIDLHKGELSHKQRETADDFPKIISVRLNAEDIRRECAKAIEAERPKAKARGVTEFREWLAQQRREIQSQPPTKRILAAVAKKRFGVGPRQFENGWKLAAIQVPNEFWGKAGRPKEIVTEKS